MTQTTKTAARASLSQLQGLATQGVERALAAPVDEAVRRARDRHGDIADRLKRR